MSNTRIRRQFSPGSRPPPDPYDKYLDFEGFYRKHTARDASCLFRVISEQMFDTQEFHEQIRMDCVNFMIKNRADYEEKIQIDFDEYMCKMSKPKTYGTLLELRAMGYMYRRNIRLFKPYDLGTWLIREKSFDEPCFRVFYSPDRHFDSVFTKAFISKAAFCQAICYEILYKNVYRLPDIEYSVEVMLHSNNENDVGSNAYSLHKNCSDKYASHIVLPDGRKCQSDTPENTLCILDDYRLCHFHNPDFNIIFNPYTFDNPHIQSVFRLKSLYNASLPAKYISCVRQLLNQGITPFPYRVAKALDPDIYRNIEFDTWSENRKELRSKYYYSNGWNFQIGQKCLVKLNENKDEFFKCYIQEMSPNRGLCVVYVEDLAEKHSVPYSFLLPLNDTKSWMLPHRYNRNRANSYNTFTQKELRHDKKYLLNVNNQKYNANESELIEYTKAFDSSYQDADKIYDLEPYTNLSNFHHYSFDLVTMPLSITRTDQCTPTNGHTKIEAESNSNLNNLAEQQQIQQPLVQDQQNEPSQAVSSYIPPNSTGFYYMPTTEYADQGYYSIPPELINSPNFYPPPPPPSLYTNMNVPFSNGGYCANPAMPANSMYSPLPNNNWSNYNPAATGYYMPAPPNPPIPYTVSTVPLHMFVRRKDLLFSNGQANYSAEPSYAPQGNDLPLNDKVTLRFFYNMGHELLKYIQNTYGMNQFLALVDGENQDVSGADRAETAHNQLVTDFQQLNVESHNSETGTPNKHKVNTSYHSGNANNRRYFNPKFRKDKPNFSQHRQPHHTYHPSNPSNTQNGASAKKVFRNPTHNGSKIAFGHNVINKDADNKNDSNTKDNNNTNTTNDANNNNKGNHPVTNVEDNNNNNNNYYKNDADGYNKFSKNIKVQHSESHYQHVSASVPVNREPFYNPPDIPNYGSLYSAYQPQYMPYYPVDANEQQPMYMPMNIYTQPGIPRGPIQQQVPLPPPMPSPCEIMPEPSEPFMANYNNQPSFLYPPPVIPPPPPQLSQQNYYYPSPAVVQHPPPRSLNTSNISSSSSNNTGANSSNPSQ